MNSTANPTTTQAQDPQTTVAFSQTANKAEMLKRIEHAYQLSNQLYERIGKVVDMIYDKRSAMEAFQGTDEFSTSQVDHIIQALGSAIDLVDQELS